jgi:hypothetical protein
MLGLGQVDLVELGRAGYPAGLGWVCLGVEELENYDRSWVVSVRLLRAS